MDRTPVCLTPKRCHQTFKKKYLITKEVFDKYLIIMDLDPGGPKPFRHAPDPEHCCHDLQTNVKIPFLILIYYLLASRGWNVTLAICGRKVQYVGMTLGAALALAILPSPESQPNQIGCHKLQQWWNF
jgi:hypothetical protein